MRTTYVIHLVGRQWGWVLPLCLFSAVACADVFRWTDEHGRIHFGDKPPLDASTEPVDIRVNSYSAPQIIEQPVEPEVADVRHAKRVVMYSASWCGVCKRAAAYFRSHNIPFQEYDVETSARGRVDFRSLGGRGVPIILVGKARMNGFSPQHFEQLYKH